MGSGPGKQARHMGLCHQGWLVLGCGRGVDFEKSGCCSRVMSCAVLARQGCSQSLCVPGTTLGGNRRPVG